jgi:hypothetical protein
VGEGDHLQGPGVEQVSHQNFLDLNNPEQDQTQNSRGNGISDFSQRFCSEIPLIKIEGQAVFVLCIPGSLYMVL